MPKSKRESRAINPFPFMGLRGQALIFVIPAKAGIRMIEAKLATRKQARIASDKSLPP